MSGTTPRHLSQAVDAAASLLDRDSLGEVHPEYTRGMCELLARMYPFPDVDTGSRAETMRHYVLARMEAQAS